MAVEIYLLRSDLPWHQIKPEMDLSGAGDYDGQGFQVK